MSVEKIEAAIAEAESDSGAESVGVCALEPGEDGDPKIVNPKKAYETLPEAKIAPNGLFKHPSELTDEEYAIVVTGIRARVPIYKIAVKIHCERSFLSQYIKKDADLAQLWLDSREARVDDCEDQFDRLVRTGNPSAVIYGLQTLGRSRGWGGVDDDDPDGMLTSKVVFGEISDAEIALANAKRLEMERRSGLLDVKVDPVDLAGRESAEMEADAAQRAAEDKVEALAAEIRQKSVEAEVGDAKPDAKVECVEAKPVAERTKNPPFVAEEMRPAWDDGDYGFGGAADGESPFGSF